MLSEQDEKSIGDNERKAAARSMDDLMGRPTRIRILVHLRPVRIETKGTHAERTFTYGTCIMFALYRQEMGLYVCM